MVTDLCSYDETVVLARGGSTLYGFSIALGSMRDLIPCITCARTGKVSVRRPKPEL